MKGVQDNMINNATPYREDALPPPFGRGSPKADTAPALKYGASALGLLVNLHNRGRILGVAYRAKPLEALTFAEI